MKPTRHFIENKFEEFNRQMFAGRLPKPLFELTDAGGFLGKCVYSQRQMPDGTMKFDGFILRFSYRMDLPENVYEDTVIHEMIHYFILWAGLNDSSSHGHIFKAIMESINGTYGRNISIRHQSTEEEAQQAVSTKRTWHVIAAIYFNSGKTGVKVLPRTIPKIQAYYEAASRHPGVVQVRLYLHDNPFFNRYPTSAALRIHDIDKGILEQNLQKARKFKIIDNRFVEEK